MFDLGELKPKPMEKVYTQRLSLLQGMPLSTIKAHLSSMVHSQRSDYQSDMRLLLDEKEGYDGSGDPFDPGSYKLKGVEEAVNLCHEVVIVHKGRKYVWKARDGKKGFVVDGVVVPDSPVTASPLAATRKQLEL